jgi:hypothetical protein
METKIVCYANEKDCRCIVDIHKLDAQEQYRVYEAIYGKFNRFAYVSNTDGVILIKNIENCSPTYHSEEIELVVNMCEEIISQTISYADVRFWGQCPDDMDFGFTVLFY